MWRQESKWQPRNFTSYVIFYLYNFHNNSMKMIDLVTQLWRNYSSHVTPKLQHLLLRNKEQLPNFS